MNDPMDDDGAAIDVDVIVTRAVMPLSWGIYALAFMQVCAHSECPPDHVERRANELNPCGPRLVWRITHKGPGDVDLPPAQCQRDPVRIHYVLSC